MTVTLVNTLVTERRLPSPSPDGVSQPAPEVYPAPDFPFKGWIPTQPEGYRQSAATPTESAIVIDNGACTVKAGWSFDKKPRFVFPPIVARFRDRKYNKTCTYVGYDAYADATTRGQIRNAFEPNTSIVSNWDVMEGVLDYIFLKLGIDGAEGGVGRPIVMTEPVANLGYTRRMMNEILFECYSAPSVTYGVDSLLAYRYNKGDSGLVISSSHTATHIIPVLHGKAHLQSCSRLNWGGFQAQEFLMKLLRLKYPTFPGRMTNDQMEEYIKQYCYISPSYSAELSTYLDWTGLEESRDIIIQYPFTEHVVVEKSAEELARIAERKKESGRRLRDQAAKMRLEKLIKKEQELDYYKALHQNYLNATTKKEQRRLLENDELRDEAALERTIRDLEKSIRKSRNKDLGGEEEEAVEEQTFPLLDVPDDQLDEAGLKEKRHQRLMKSGVEARARARAEKERESARRAEEERLDVEKRENNFEEWVAERRALHDALLLKIKERERMKADAGNRKSLASQMRMKTLANLASDTPGKRKRRGGGEYDDNFGANDDDWGVYRSVAAPDAAAGSDDEDEEDPEAQLKSVESDLLAHDPDFSEKDTREAQNDWTKSMMHAFLRGARPSDPESVREANQIHLNVERIRVPEVVFQPSIAGVDQAGLVEVIEGVVLGRFQDLDEQKLLLKDVFMTGGQTLFRGFEERLRNDLQAALPETMKIKVRRAQDPIFDAWSGAAWWWSGASKGEMETATVTRQEYEDKGSEYAKDHPLGNSMAPNIGFAG